MQKVRTHNTYSTMLTRNFVFLLAFSALALSCASSKKEGTTQADPLPMVNQIKAFPSDWTMLQRDSIGYLVYDPCDGSTPQIFIDSDTLTIAWQLEFSKHRIVEIRQIDEKSYHIKAVGHFEEGAFSDPDFEVVVSVTYKNEKRTIALWKWSMSWDREALSNYKWVMTPSIFESRFRQVDNPCFDRKILEKEFLEVEYD